MQGVLNIYSMDFHIEELNGLSSLKKYSLQENVIDFENIQNLSSDAPALFIFRNPQNETALWRYIRRVRERKVNAAFLFLISKQDFALLYGACQNAVTAVLMEPASRTEMEHHIKMCLKRIDEVTRIQKDRERLEIYEYQKQQKIMDRLLANVINKPDEVELLLPEINKRYGTKLGEKNYQVMIIGVNQRELCNKDSHFLKEVTLLAIRTLKYAKDMIIGYQEPYGLIGIVCYKDAVDKEDRKEDYRRLWKRIMKLQGYYGEFLVTLAVGNMTERIAGIRESLKVAGIVQEYRMISTDYVLLAEELGDIDCDYNQLLPERKIKELVRYVSLGDIRHVNSWFLDFYQNIEPEFMKYPAAYAYFCWKIHKAIEKKEKNMETEVFSEWKFFALQHIFNGSERIKELEVILLEICHMMKQGLSKERELSAQAIAYMKVHYAEPINLEYMAEKCGLSTSYFSRKFKEQTGEKYIDVLTDIRIREAQRLLGTTKEPVALIVEQVGYCDEKHFRRVFQKATGMNPLTYRKRFQQDEWIE